jgi:calcineurin-like phosphoesterase
MTIFYAAEIVGKAGIAAFKEGFARLRSERRIDFCIVSADGATAGGGLGLNHALYLRKLGADAVLLGDMAFFKKDLTEKLPTLRFVARPLNFLPTAPGCGLLVFEVPGGGAGDLGKKKERAKPLAVGSPWSAPLRENSRRVVVATFLGQSGFSRIHAENPYFSAQNVFSKHEGGSQDVQKPAERPPVIIVDFHALATAEKKTLSALLDGKVTAVLGSHTRVATSDERVSPGGTASITDAGRTGSSDSVFGLDKKARID